MLTIKNSFRAASIVTGLFAVSAGHADTQTQSWNIPSTLIPVAGTTQNNTVGLFDSSAGTLTNVSVSLVLDGYAHILLTNATGSEQYYSNATMSNLLLVTMQPSPTLLVDTTLTASSSFGTVDPFPGYTFIHGTTEHFNTGTVDLASSAWSSLEAPGGGSGLFPITFIEGTATSGVTSVPGVNLFSGETVGGSGSSLELTYTYTPFRPAGTPEPGSLALLTAGGMCALGTVIRKRRSAR